MTRQEIAALIALCVANAPHQQDRDLRMTASLWEEGLSDLAFPVAKAAVLRVLSTSEFWPSLAKIRESAEIIMPRTQELPTPEQAWDEVLRQITKVGWTGSPTWSHPQVGRAAEAMYGGWLNLCKRVNDESVVADRAHFFRMYNSFTLRQRELAQLPDSVKNLIAGVTNALALPSGKPKGDRSGEG